MMLHIAISEMDMFTSLRARISSTSIATISTSSTSPDLLPFSVALRASHRDAGTMASNHELDRRPRIRMLARWPRIGMLARRPRIEILVISPVGRSLVVRLVGLIGLFSLTSVKLDWDSAKISTVPFIIRASRPLVFLILSTTVTTAIATHFP